MIYRRQRRQYIFLVLLAVIGIVNVLFFFILNRPARVEYGELQKSIEDLGKVIGTGQRSLTTIERTNTLLGRFDQDKRTLLMTHLVQRRMGYSQILTLLDSMVQRAGVKKTRVTYSLNPEPQAGLNSLSILLPLEGSYSNVVNFIRALETSDTFFLINSINVEGSSQPATGARGAPAGGTGGSGAVQLSLTLEAYFYQ